MSDHYLTQTDTTQETSTAGDATTAAPDTNSAPAANTEATTGAPVSSTGTDSPTAPPPPAGEASGAHETTATEGQAERDPFDLLMNAGRDPQLLLLLGGPILFLALVMMIAGIVIFLRRRREARHLDDALAKSEAGLLDTSAEDEAEARESKPYEVPPELEEPRESRGHLRLVRPEEKAPVPTRPAEIEEVRRTDQLSWMARLRGGLAKTRDSLNRNIGSIFSGQAKIDESTLEQLHEVLFRADIGVKTADKLVDQVRTTLKGQSNVPVEQIGALLKKEAQTILDQPQRPVNAPAAGPFVILIVGVNGVGKTTTIGKLAAHFLAEDKKVLLAAGDTFRAAAIEQLQVWGERLGVDVIRHQQGSDPAAVAYDAVKAAMARHADVLIIDTAGRLHSKAELMDELGKINRVIGRDLPGAPHETWLVIDATTGQNAVQQVKAFSEVVGVTGLVVTKLDGTAKGGVVIGIADQFKLPIRYVGVGEKAADLRSFNAADYVDSLF